MANKVSVVINTFNEEENIKRAMNSVSWADEILVCDMYSSDKTKEVAKELGARIILHKKEGYVEPARNFAISKARNEWILILDADEEIPESLSSEIKKMINKPISSDFVELPRKNIIFNKWIKATGWWPDYHVRFFKKGKVLWNNKIHEKPETKGLGITLPPEEKWAIVHYNYQTVRQFIQRMDRYTQIQANQLRKSGYQFKWQDVFQKPTSEFLSRYFSNKGYKDGLHGLALSFLQSFSFLVLYLKIWEMNGFKEQELGITEFENEGKLIGKDINYWINQSVKPNPFKKIFKIFKR